VIDLSITVRISMARLSREESRIAGEWAASVVESTRRRLFYLLIERCQIMKVGVIRCMQTEDMCPGTTDFKVIKAKKGAFEGVEGEIEIIGFNSCGGCPGKKAVTRAAEMVSRGADTIALASCITRGNPIGFACPHAREMKAAIAKRIGEDVTILDYTH
jgi:predicted metal-binding protein